MMRQFITSGEGLPNWTNPISHAVVVNNMCFISGQLSVDVDGNYVSGNNRQEAEIAFSNLFSAVSAAGFSKSDLVFIDIAFSDLDGLEEVNQYFIELFPEGKRPARTVYEASKLPFGGKIKVTGIAVKEE